MLMLNRVNELDKKITTVKNDLNVERTQRTGADYSIGMRLRISREIGEWFEYCKSCSITLYGALDPVDKFGTSIAETFKGDAEKCAKWARKNSNDFAYAWVNGY